MITGSKTVIFKDVFIAEERTLKTRELSEGTHAGTYVNDGVLYRAGVEYTFSLPLAGAVVGAARSLVNAFTDKVRSRIEGPNPITAFEQQGYLARLARAGGDVAAARALLIDDARTYCYAPADQFDALDRIRIRRDVAYAAQLCRDAANSLFGAAGGTAVFEGTELQRLWHDSVVASFHHGLAWDIHGFAYARATVGLPTSEVAVAEGSR